ncbi:MAG: PAS domain-containing sensor histidine kinase [Duodenibacillus sp.]|nr:PAS domain-containing sensor histidine kinase [Duodenibacillus sp.]
MAKPDAACDRRLLAAGDLLSTCVALIDGGCRILWCNAAMEALLGGSRKTLTGARVTAYLPRARDWLVAGMRTTAEARVVRSMQEVVRPMADAVAVQVSFSTVAPGQYMLEVAPVDEMLQHLRKAQESGLSDASKALLRNLAHEIKNPLGGIRGAAQLLEQELANPELREYTDVIIGEADRLQRLVDRVLSPYRRTPNKGEVNLHELLEKARLLLLAEHPRGLQILRDYDVSAPAVQVDAEQIHQVLLNIMRNAAEAMAPLIARGAAQLQLRTRMARHVIIQEKRYRLALSVQIVDNGPGIKPELREKIFYPLVTGREGGTGLGLSLAQTFVERNGGAIEVDSEPGRTVFTVLFGLSEPVSG